MKEPRHLTQRQLNAIRNRREAEQIKREARFRDQMATNTGTCKKCGMTAEKARELGVILDLTEGVCYECIVRERIKKWLDAAK